MTDIETTARAEAERRWEYDGSPENARARACFIAGAAWLAAQQSETRASVCTPAFGGISDGPNVDCPVYGDEPVLTKDEAQAVMAVDAMARSTHLSYAQVMEALTQIRRQPVGITEEAVEAAAIVIYGGTAVGWTTLAPGWQEHYRNFGRKALEAAEAVRHG